MKPTPAPAPAPTIIVTSPAELAALVRDSVHGALAEQRQDPAPLLLDRHAIAKALGIGLSSVDRFRKAGMPCVWVGDSPRFEPLECLAWMKLHKRSADTEEHAAEEHANGAGRVNGSSSSAPS